MDIPSYTVVAFLGKLDMTNNLVTQLLDQGECERIYLMNNGDREDYPWRGSKVRTVMCTGWGLYRMFNRGIELSLNDCGGHTEWPKNIAILNNDIELNVPGFIGYMGQSLRHPGVGLVAGNDGGNGGPVFQEANYEQGFRGACIMLRGEVPIRFDDRFELYRGDSDLQYQFQAAGWRIGIAPYARYTHIGGGANTVATLDRDTFDERLQRDDVRYGLKWPFIPNGTYSYPSEMFMAKERTDVITFVP